MGEGHRDQQYALGVAESVGEDKPSRTGTDAVKHPRIGYAKMLCIA